MAEQDIWTIRAALEWTQGYLERKGDENPRVSAQWLLSEACGLSRIELYTNYERPLSMEERDILRGYVTRRGTGEPLQYITGEVGFRHITVKVRPGVLIPRPETEVLVSEALATLPPLPTPCATDSRFEFELEGSGGEEPDGDDAKETPSDRGALCREAQVGAETFSKEPSDSVGCSGGAAETEAEDSITEVQGYAGLSDRQVLVADLCTGSGCIACSIAHEYPNAHVIATDIAPEAIALAHENALQLGLSDQIEIIECNLGSGISSEQMGSFDLIVSNPPYIPSAVLAGLPREVSDFEPPLALDGGKDGLDFFRSIAKWSKRALADGGALVVELHEDCLEEAALIAEQQGFSSSRIVYDLTNRPRILVVSK